MTAAPSPVGLATELERVAHLLRTAGPTAVDLADLLAARGWPSHTSGPTSIDDNGDVQLTSVEAAVDRPGPWVNIDDDLAHSMRTVWSDIGRLSSIVARIVAHADADSAVERTTRRSGSGSCLACARHVAGSATDRLRAGMCDACRKAWERDGRPDRAWWCRRRSEELAPAGPVHVDPTVAGSVP
jgi:hypothetical protein